MAVTVPLPCPSSASCPTRLLLPPPPSIHPPRTFDADRLNTARRCPPAPQCHPPPFYYRPRPGRRAHARGADPLPRRLVSRIPSLFEPYLNNLLESVEDEDEVLVALSGELGNFIEYVGGPQWGHVLLSPLENLAAIEEPVVRDKVAIAPFSTCNLRRLTSTGRRVPQQDLRGAVLPTSRRILHSLDGPFIKSRLVHLQGLWLRPLHNPLQEGFSRRSRRASEAVWPARPR